MVMKLGNKKKAFSNRKEGIAKLGDEYVYIKTVGVKSDKRTVAMQKFEESFKIPEKFRTLTVPEQKKMEELTGNKIQRVIRELDDTTLEHKEYMEHNALFSTILEMVINIDGGIEGYDDGNDGVCDIWDYLSIPKNDYFELTELIMSEDKFSADTNDLNIFREEIEKIKNKMPSYAEIELNIKSSEDILNEKEIKELDEELNKIAQDIIDNKGEEADE